MFRFSALYHRVLISCGFLHVCIQTLHFIHKDIVIYYIIYVCCRMVISKPPRVPIFKNWRDCWSHLKDRVSKFFVAYCLHTVLLELILQKNLCKMTSQK